MQIMADKRPEGKTFEPLLLSSEQAAKALGISVRYLFTLRQREEIFSVKMGNKLMYSVEMLRAFANGESVERWRKTSGTGAKMPADLDSA
jgi:hypothetical protein